MVCRTRIPARRKNGRDKEDEESRMSKFLTSLLVLGLVAGMSACAPAPEQEEVIIIDPEPIEPEGSYTKYD